jgi:hypothetical protein
MEVGAMTRHALQERLNDTWYREQSADDASNAIWGEPFDGETVRISDFEAERTARKALTKALMICIRYADSSADTEQAHAALALAARLP